MRNKHQKNLNVGKTTHQLGMAGPNEHPGGDFPRVSLGLISSRCLHPPKTLFLAKEPGKQQYSKTKLLDNN